MAGSRAAEATVVFMTAIFVKFAHGLQDILRATGCDVVLFQERQQRGFGTLTNLQDIATLLRGALNKFEAAFEEQRGVSACIVSGSVQLHIRGSRVYQVNQASFKLEAGETPYVPVEGASSYPGLRQGYSGPTPEVLHRGDSPMALFFYFMPVALWQHVAVCSNKYQRDMLHARVADAYKRHKRRCQANPATKKKTRRDVLQELQAVPPIKPHELCRFVGLLIARTICPN
ncbi:hypothetical protein L917_15299 [Phytophthora nicotianae]|uniref:Uncharacterized protein n=1 Tax=Phytophthora nicotianae TaxID=4792 RepID=W2KIZ7_PHYNI|nr:hypothetical protein L917_15299 [Phytophthora nicotianae]